MIRPQQIRTAIIRIAVLLPTSSMLLPITVQADDTILARGWTHENYGRLVLDTGSAELTDIKVSGDVMVINFKRPISVDMTAAMTNLPAYVSGATPSTDRKQLVLRLKRAVNYRQFSDNGNLVIDLGVPSPAVKPALPDGASLLTSPPAGATLGKVPFNVVIQPRAGEHSGYSRIAFDLPDVAGVSVRQDGNRVTLQFSSGGSLDLTKLQRDLPSRLQTVLTQNSPQGQRITLSLKPGIVLRAQQQGRVIVLDLFDANKAPAAKPAPLAVAATDSKLAALSPAPSPTNISSPVSETTLLQNLTPVAALPGQPLTQSQQPPVQTQPATATSDAKVSEALTNLAETPVPSLPSAPVDQAAPPPSPVDVPVTVAPGVGGGAIVTFQWPKPTELAAFKRGDTFWLVFDAAANFPGGAFNAQPLSQLGRIDQIDDRYASGFRLKNTSTPTPIIHATGNTWVVELVSNQQGGAAKTVQQRRETLAQGGSSLLLQAVNPGPVLTLFDPAIGDHLKVAPLRDAGLGVAEQAVWPEFKLLPSYQGIVVAPLADSVSVEPLPNGVVVTTAPAVKPQMAVAGETNKSPSESQAGIASVQVTSNQAQATSPAGDQQADEVIGVPGIFDLPAWRRGGQATFLRDHDNLEEAITKASPIQRNAARLQLAQFLFANGLVPEAAGMLDIIAANTGSLAMDSSGLITLRAAAHVLKGDDDLAAQLLADPQVVSSPEASLFRGVLASHKGDQVGAAKMFNQPLPILKDYPKSLRTDLALVIGKALIEGGNPMQAQVFTDAVRKDMPNSEITDRLAYLEGLRQLKLGQRDAAFETWQGLKESAVEDVRAQSQFAVIMEKLRSKQMTEAEAIGPLEELRFLTRGGDFEFNLLRKLGEAYLAAQQPRKGLLTLRQAVTNFPNRADTKDVAQEMSDAFQHLYLEGGADALSPMMAVALYDEFRELTPSGTVGDRMIAALADRLVKVDLLDGAAKLLDGQVKHRLTGVDKARAGARLAAVYLLNDKPDQAAQALNDSLVSDQLPGDLTALRRRLQSQADFGVGQTLKALDEINGDNSLAAHWQRADMLWQLQEWPAAAAALSSVIDGEETAIEQQAAQIMARNNVAVDPSAALRGGDVQAGSAVSSADSDTATVSPAPAAVTYTNVLAKVRSYAFKTRLAKVVLNRAVALSLANNRAELHKLGRDYGKDMAQTDLAHAFDMLTSPGNGLAESVTAEMASVDQINSFVDEYRAMMKQASLSAPSLTN